MKIAEQIYKLRTAAKMTQEQLAETLHVSRQSVQKWENGQTVPELSKLIEISECFGISLDALILEREPRVVEDMKYDKLIKPSYARMQDWDLYSSDLGTEFKQSADEGRDVEVYRGLFEAAGRLPSGEVKKKLGDLLFETVMKTPLRADYPYTEPSDLDSIRALRAPHALAGKADEKSFEKKLYGAWMGRICGCMLGKTVEGIRTNELVPFLKETDNYPMHRYILRSDLKNELWKKYSYPLNSRPYADEIDGMPVDDDTNYVILAQLLIERFGRNFTPYDVSRIWLDCQSKNAYFTAERVAYHNFIKGYEPPQSAVHKNPYREWIGAQIRGDYFGYINPGKPALAAEMAWRDASVSHVKNGIYGEMLVSAMIAAAVVTADREEILLAGLAEIPTTSRLYESIHTVLDGYKAGVTQKDCFAKIHAAYDEYTGYGWCHTISNAMIVAASLLYGEGDYTRSVCMAVETGYDTDCNGATVGSVLGMASGIDSIPTVWTEPMRDTLHTSIFGVGTVKISERVQMTLKHVRF